MPSVSWRIDDLERLDVLPQAADRVPGLGEPVYGVLVGVPEHRPDGVEVGLVAFHQGIDGVQLDDQGAEVVGQDVVDLASRIGPLRQMGRLGPLDLGPFHVGQPELGLLRPQRRLSDGRTEQETSDGDQPVGPVGGRVAGRQRGQRLRDNGKCGEVDGGGRGEGLGRIEAGKYQQHRRRARVVTGQDATGQGLYGGTDGRLAVRRRGRTAACSGDGQREGDQDDQAPPVRRPGGGARWR